MAENDYSLLGRQAPFNGAQVAESVRARLMAAQLLAQSAASIVL